jgi:steroid delta-isomerase-like uncharacterized protein
MGDVAEAGRRHDDAFNAKDVDARRALETDDVEVVLPGGMTLRGTDQALELLRVFWEALPDARLEHATETESGDTVVFEGTLTGTHTGPFRAPQGEVPPSGNAVNVRYAAVKRVRDGKVASDHVYFDQLEFMLQIGAMAGP